MAPGCCAPPRHDVDGAEYSAADRLAPNRGPGHDSELMVIRSGKFRMGSDSAEGFVGDGEGPVRTVALSDFRIEPYAVSNDRFAAFVETTSYLTDAELWVVLRLRRAASSDRSTLRDRCGGARCAVVVRSARHQLALPCWPWEHHRRDR